MEPDPTVNNNLLKRAGRALLTGLKIVFKCLLLLPIPVYLVWFNLTTAEASALQVNRFEREYAQALLAGQPIRDYEQVNERLILQLLTENMEQPFNTIALGSSRVMQLGNLQAGTTSFYNCGLSGADYRDILNNFYLFDKAGMLPQNVILALDPWILNGNEDALHNLSDADLLEEFKNEKLGYATLGYAPTEEEKAAGFLDALNVTAFRQNLEYNQEDAEAGYTPPVVAEEDIYESEQQIKMPDGTLLYTQEFREAGITAVERRATAEASSFLRMEDYKAPDSDLCLLFHRFVQYMQSRGVNVIFLLLPYHPIVYDYAAERQDIYPGFFLTEPWFIRYANLYNIPLYGSYNPYVTDTQDDKFYDGLHIIGDYIDEFFPGVPAVNQAKATGRAKSPWLLGTRPRVQYQTAERLVRQKYEIPDNEELRPAGDLITDGLLCYRINRYSSTETGSVLMAELAVCRSSGLILRWEASAGRWVPDQRFPR